MSFWIVWSPLLYRVSVTFAAYPVVPLTAAVTTTRIKEQIIFPEIEYDKIDALVV